MGKNRMKQKRKSFYNTFGMPFFLEPRNEECNDYYKRGSGNGKDEFFIRPKSSVLSASQRTNTINDDNSVEIEIKKLPSVQSNKTKLEDIIDQEKKS